LIASAFIEYEAGVSLVVNPRFRNLWRRLVCRSPILGATSRLCALHVLSVAWFALSACRAPAPPQHEVASHASQRIAFSDPDDNGWGTAGELRFLELVTKGADRTQALPWIVLIHGMGDAPSPDWLEVVELDVPVRVIMPQAPYSYGTGYSWFNYNIHGDNPPDQLASGITSAMQRIEQLIESIPAHRRCVGRPIAMGFSQGGMLSYALATHAGPRVRFALPIAGFLPEPLWPTAPTPNAPPIRALHGTADQLVPIAGARALTKRLTQLGYDARLEEFANLGHSMSPELQARVHALLQPELHP
jgi:phospholipase/carboxylesterase